MLFFKLSSKDKFWVILICFTIFLFGFILSNIVEQNTKAYWKLMENVAAADIEKIEIRRIDDNYRKTIGTPITINDRIVNICRGLAVKTMQEYQPNHPDEKNYTKVKLWLTNGQTIEFTCYTQDGEGNTIFVSDSWIEPNIYGYGNGKAKFPAPKFYEWLMGAGIKF